MATFESRFSIGDEVVYSDDTYTVMWVTFCPFTITYRIENEYGTRSGIEESTLKPTEIEGE